MPVPQHPDNPLRHLRLRLRLRRLRDLDLLRGADENPRRPALVTHARPPDAPVARAVALAQLRDAVLLAAPQAGPDERRAERLLQDLHPSISSIAARAFARVRDSASRALRSAPFAASRAFLRSVAFAIARSFRRETTARRGRVKDNP